MNQKGMTVVEYTLLLMTIAAAIVLGLGLFGQSVRSLFQTAAQIFQ